MFVWKTHLDAPKILAPPQSDINVMHGADLPKQMHKGSSISYETYILCSFTSNILAEALCSAHILSDGTASMLELICEAVMDFQMATVQHLSALAVYTLRK